MNDDVWLRRQASAWLDQHSFSDPWVVILGLGAGYHVEAFGARFPESRVTVLDVNEAVVNASQGRRFPSGLIECHHIMDEQFAGTDLCRRIFEEMPPILCFQPAFGEDQQKFDRIFRLLTGRSREGLETFFSVMGVDVKLSEEIAGGRHLLTMKDLGFVIDQGGLGLPSVSAVRVLRELLV